MARQEHEPGQEQQYSQLHFEAWEDHPTPEMTLDYCIVTTQPTYAKNGKGYVWDCAIYAPPDLLNQDRNETYHLHASNYAQEANKKRLKPGDVVLLTGVPWTQDIVLQGGETQTLNHLTVSEIVVVSRAARKTITVYEQHSK